MNTLSSIFKQWGIKPKPAEHIEIEFSIDPTTEFLPEPIVDQEDAWLNDLRVEMHKLFGSQYPKHRIADIEVFRDNAYVGFYWHGPSWGERMVIPFDSAERAFRHDPVAAATNYVNDLLVRRANSEG